MSFVKYDLGQLSGGEVATVDVRERANVLLIDQPNFIRYQRKQQFNYYGGQALRSPVRLEVPTAGHSRSQRQQRGHPLERAAVELSGRALLRTQSTHITRRSTKCQPS